MNFTELHMSYTLQQYTSLSSLIKILRSRKFRLSPITNYNDALEEVDIQNPKNFYAVCFSRCTTNMLMWAHYADSYKGCKIVIDLKKYKEAGIEFKKIIYTTRLKRNQKGLSDYDKLLCKGKRWEYECENRYLVDLSSLSNNDKNVLKKKSNNYYISAYIKSICFGFKVPENSDEYLEALRLIEEINSNAIKTANIINVIKTEINENDFSIVTKIFFAILLISLNYFVFFIR